MQKITPLLILPLALLSATLSHAAEWTNQAGNTMEADFVRTKTADGETIAVFKNRDGMHYQFALSDLTEADQKRVADIQTSDATSNATSTEEAEEMTRFEQAITKHLVRSKGKRTSRAPQSTLTPKDYYAIYYSAHWCPPCRKFTPKLVDFYNEASKTHDNFEIIFVSSDRDEDAMANYMHEADMPWLALDYDKKKKSTQLTRFSGNGIPCLVLVDKDGKVISDSYVDDQYVGPTKVMRDLQKQLEEN